MQNRESQFRRLPGFLPAGWVLALLVLLAGGLAGSEAGHAVVHADAGESGHHCVIDLFASGLAETGLDFVPMPVPAFRTSGILPVPSLLLPAPGPVLQPPGRAPPFCA